LIAPSGAFQRTRKKKLQSVRKIGVLHSVFITLNGESEIV